MSQLLIRVFLSLVFILWHFTGFSQHTITGYFPPLAGKLIHLKGFDGFKTYTIDSAEIDIKGVFKLNYSDVDEGMGILMVKGDKSFFIVLSGQAIELAGDLLGETNKIKIIKGLQNQVFFQYAMEQPRREQALSAWSFLEKSYAEDPLFSVQTEAREDIKKEQERIKLEEQVFLSALAPNSYVRWFLPVRKLVSSVRSIAQYRVNEIEVTINAFRELDYSDSRLHKSGLLKDALEGHFWLLENNGEPLDSIYKEMKVSIDYLIEDLVIDEEKLNSYTEYLFNFLEKRSLFEASEYLALKVLNEVSCTVNNDLAKQLEGYRKMAKGETAPDFKFGEHTYYSEGAKPSSLSQVGAKNILVIFAASWCNHCQEEMPKIASFYPKWKAKDVEVVMVSLDTDPKEFVEFAAPLPFISTCDYQKWDSPVAQDYHIFGTPTYYLLDKDLKILVKAKSPEQVDAWVDYKL